MVIGGGGGGGGNGCTGGNGIGGKITGCCLKRKMSLICFKQIGILNNHFHIPSSAACTHLLCLSS
jgi:hypothetical protein